MSDKILHELRRVVLGIYDSHGLAKAKEKALEFLKDSNKAARQTNKKDIAGIFRGELSELMLQIHLKEYVATNKNCFYTKGLTIPRTDGRDGYTEIDLALYTLYGVYLFESKSYSEEKILTDKCLLVRKRYPPYDVYSQSSMHLKNLKTYLDPARKVSLEEGKPYGMIFFGLSNDILTDQRTEEWKEKMPATDEESILEYLNSLESKKQIWDIQKLYSIVSDLKIKSDANFKRHVKALKKKN